MTAVGPVVPAHVAPALVTDFDIYAPAGPGEDFHAAWVRLQASTDAPGAVKELIGRHREGSLFISRRGEPPWR